MQSFAPMEVTIWADGDINDVYVPASICWLEGSDYDIDKQYLVGHSVSHRGEIKSVSGKPWMKEHCLKNSIVDSIWQVVTDPKNQINLTEPVETSHAKALSKLSKLGQQAKWMSPFDPSCKFSMQLENMVGRACIGNVATGIKSFFALQHAYNNEISAVVNALSANDFDTARAIFSRIPRLANLRVLELENALKNPNIPSDLRAAIQSFIEFQDSCDDQSLLLGELLNCATDNAKELILKKINADSA